MRSQAVSSPTGRFNPVSMLGSGDEDGVLDALVGLAAGSVSLMGPSYSVRYIT